MNCDREHAAFVQHLFERYRAALLRHATGLLRQRRDAEDIVQETYARLLAAVDLERLATALLQLRPRCRQIFLLRAAEGLSFEAIAERLGIGKRTVEREMKHALDVCQRRLRRTLE